MPTPQDPAQPVESHQPEKAAGSGTADSVGEPSAYRSPYGAPQPDQRYGRAPFDGTDRPPLSGGQYPYGDEWGPAGYGTEPPYGGAPGYAQPPYGPAPGYAQPGGYPATPYYVISYPKNNLGIVSLIFGLLGLCIPLALSIVAIITGHLSRGAQQRGEANNGSLGTTGMVLGYVGAVLGLRAVVSFLGLFGFGL